MKHRICAFQSFALIAAACGAVEVHAKNGNAVLLERIGGADANRDGFVSKQELIAFRAANFARLDGNADGVLMRSDIPAMAKRFNPDVDFDRLIEQFDADKDGKVARDEFVKGPTTIFDAADSNRDGLLSTAERNSAIKAAKD